MLKIIILGPYPQDDCSVSPSSFNNPDMICHYEQVLGMWRWHPEVMKWFRDQIGYGPEFRTHFAGGMWTLESHNWRSETDTTLFLLTFSTLVRHFEVKEMTKLDHALSAHKAVLAATPEQRDAAYRDLVKVFATFELRPEPIDFDNLPQTYPSFVLLQHRSPNEVMVTIMADLARRGIAPPTIGNNPLITERFIFGLLAKFPVDSSL